MGDEERETACTLTFGGIEEWLTIKEVVTHRYHSITERSTGEDDGNSDNDNTVR